MNSFLHAYFAKQSGLTPAASYSLVDHVIAATANWTGGGGGGVSDHGALTGLGDDDHTQYLNNTRGDARYYTKALADAAFATISSVTAALAGKSNTGHTHSPSDITGISPVAVSNSYGDLDDLPTIPSSASDVDALPYNIRIWKNGVWTPRPVLPPDYSAEAFSDGTYGSDRDPNAPAPDNDEDWDAWTRVVGAV